MKTYLNFSLSLVILSLSCIDSFSQNDIFSGLKEDGIRLSIAPYWTSYMVNDTYVLRHNLDDAVIYIKTHDYRNIPNLIRRFQ